MTLRPLSALLATPLVLALSGAAYAQATAPAGSPITAAPVPGTGATVTPQNNATGAPGAATISPNGNPAASISTDSSAAGNAGQPSRAAPQGGANK